MNATATYGDTGKKVTATAISAKAFDGYDKLKSVTIGNNVKRIGKSLRNSYIKTIRVPSGMAEKYKKIFKKKNVGSKYKITIKEK